jgi:phosphoserine phosphatase
MIWQDGKVVGVEMTNLIDGEQKASNLTKYCLANGIDLSDAVCFGDGANDIPMMKVVQKAGGVAFAVSAKKVVQEQADHQLNDFSNIIELFEQQTR